MAPTRTASWSSTSTPIDRTKWNPEQISLGRYRGGIDSWEGVKWIPTEEFPPEQHEGLDSLYKAETFDRYLDPEGRPVHLSSPGLGAICAMRYRSTNADTSSGTQFGRLIFFDFQPYYFDPDRITSAGTAAADWLVRGWR